MTCPACGREERQDRKTVLGTAALSPCTGNVPLAKDQEGVEGVDLVVETKLLLDDAPWILMLIQARLTRRQWRRTLLPRGPGAPAVGRQLGAHTRPDH